MRPSRQKVLQWDVVDALLEAREHGLPPDDNGTLNFIIGEWLTANGGPVKSTDDVISAHQST
jgi:hypothetical protein